MQQKTEHLEHLVADIKGLEPPQEVKHTQTLLVDCLHVCSPLQFIVQHHTQVFVCIHNVNVSPMLTGMVGGLFLLQSTTISFVFAMFSCSGFSTHNFTKLLTRSQNSSSLPPSTHNGRVIREFVQMTRLIAVLKVCSISGEEEGRRHSSLEGANVADQAVRHTVL